MGTTAHELAATLEEAIWAVPVEHLAGAEAMTRALITASGLSPPAVLAEMADETLARAVQHNLLRHPAFEEWLVNRYECALQQWFYRRTRSWERSCDLVQELYVKLLTPRVLASYNPDHPFRPWLWRVVQRFWIDELRRRRDAMEGLAEECAGTEPDPGEEAAARELRARLEEAVTALPPLERRVFLLALEGSDAQQIAQSLAIAKSKVYRLLFHARRHIERILEGPVVDPTHLPGAAGQQNEERDSHGP
jgi:RNA polymerase sigma-70 factor (ECF subfamily)